MDTVFFIALIYSPFLAAIVTVLLGIRLIRHSQLKGTGTALVVLPIACFIWSIFWFYNAANQLPAVHKFYFAFPGIPRAFFLATTVALGLAMIKGPFRMHSVLAIILCTTAALIYLTQFLS